MRDKTTAGSSKEEELVCVHRSASRSEREDEVRVDSEECEVMLVPIMSIVSAGCL